MKTIKILLFISLSAFCLPGGKSQKVEAKPDSLLPHPYGISNNDTVPWPDSTNTGKLRKSMRKADELLGTVVSGIMKSNDQLARENEFLRKQLETKDKQIVYLQSLPPDTVFKQPVYQLTRIIFSKDGPDKKEKSKIYQTIRKETGTKVRYDTGAPYFQYTRN